MVLDVIKELLIDPVRYIGRDVQALLNSDRGVYGNDNILQFSLVVCKHHGANFFALSLEFDGPIVLID